MEQPRYPDLRVEFKDDVHLLAIKIGNTLSQQKGIETSDEFWKGASLTRNEAELYIYCNSWALIEKCVVDVPASFVA